MIAAIREEINGLQLFYVHFKILRNIFYFEARIHLIDKSYSIISNRNARFGFERAGILVNK